MIASIEELVDEFQDLETPEERIQYLIELGESMPAFPTEFSTEEYRVVGCQSMVWFVPNWDGERFQFQAYSDAPMVNGLAAILVTAFNQKTPREILEFPVEKIFEGLHLKSFLSPLRSNGLNSMIKRVREYAFEAMQSAAVANHSAASPSAGASSEPRNETLSAATSLKSDGRQEPSKDLGPIADRIAQIRNDFPILSGCNSDGLPIAYLDNAASAQRPVQVIDWMDRVYREHYSNVHRSGHQWAAKTTERMEASREAVRRYINAEHVDQIVFTSGTTAAINLIAQSWGRANLKSGDVVLLSEMEHHSNIVPWQLLAREIGIEIQWIPIDESYLLDLEAYQRLLTDRVKLVAITAVSNVLGTANPVREIADAAHRIGAKVLVDAAQAVPHGPISVQNWDADWTVFSGHKMLAASGVGVLYGKRAILEAMPPWQGGGNMIKLVTKEGFSEAGLPHKLEAGTPPIVEIISFQPAVEYLESIGGVRLLEHELLLADRAIAGLKEIPGVTVYAPETSGRSGIVSFQVEGVHGESVASYLDSKGIAIRVGHHCAMPLHQKLGIQASCRASFYLYNTLEEVDRFVTSVLHSTKLFRKK